MHVLRVTADQAGLQKVAEKFKKYDFSALLLVGGFEVTFLLVNVSRRECHPFTSMLLFCPVLSAPWFQLQLSCYSPCS